MPQTREIGKFHRQNGWGIIKANCLEDPVLVNPTSVFRAFRTVSKSTRKKEKLREKSYFSKKDQRPDFKAIKNL